MNRPLFDSIYYYVLLYLTITPCIFALSLVFTVFPNHDANKCYRQARYAIATGLLLASALCFIHWYFHPREQSFYYSVAISLGALYPALVLFIMAFSSIIRQEDIRPEHLEPRHRRDHSPVGRRIRRQYHPHHHACRCLNGFLRRDHHPLPADAEIAQQTNKDTEATAFCQCFYTVAATFHVLGHRHWSDGSRRHDGQQEGRSSAVVRLCHLPLLPFCLPSQLCHAL